jgi:hypothetical protein
VDEQLDPRAALDRAARSLGVTPPRGSRDADALARAVHDYREVFRPDQLARLREGRETALAAMKTMDAFSPRLFGALVDGNGALGRVRLLLEADPAERVAWELTDQRLPWQPSESELTHAHGRRQRWPTFRFEAGAWTVELVVMPRPPHQDPPLDPLSGRRARLLDIAEVEELLQQG